MRWIFFNELNEFCDALAKLVNSLKVALAEANFNWLVSLFKEFTHYDFCVVLVWKLGLGEKFLKFHCQGLFRFLDIAANKFKLK